MENLKTNEEPVPGEACSRAKQSGGGRFRDPEGEVGVDFVGWAEAGPPLGWGLGARRCHGLRWRGGTAGGVGVGGGGVQSWNSVWGT